jgi:hypothetical protein
MTHRGPSRRGGDSRSDGRTGRRSGAVSLALAVEEAQREQREERRAPPDVLPVLAIEGTRVQTGVGGCLIALGAAGAAAALALPPHCGAVGREAEAMANHATTKHRERAYPAGLGFNAVRKNAR